MTIETKVIIHFEKCDLKTFNDWKKNHNLSLRKIGKEIGISSTYIDDMVKGRRAINEKFWQYLLKNNYPYITFINKENKDEN